jgi:hypothetical protein
VDELMALMLYEVNVKLPVKTKVPGAVILKGKEDIFMWADCAESALIIGPKGVIGGGGWCESLGS